MCASNTSLAGLNRLINEIQFAKQFTSFICLYFREDARVIKVHIEAGLASSLASIKRNIDDVVKSMKRLCEEEGGGNCEFRVVISSGNTDLQVGNTTNFLARLKESLTSNIPVKAYVPVVTALATYFVGAPQDQIKKTIVNAIISIIAIFIWSLIDAMLTRKRLQYTEA